MCVADLGDGVGCLAEGLLLAGDGGVEARDGGVVLRDFGVELVDLPVPRHGRVDRGADREALAEHGQQAKHEDQPDDSPRAGQEDELPARVLPGGDGRRRAVAGGRRCPVA